MSQRNFSNNAVETQLIVPVDDTAGSLVVGSVTGWPAVPFTILIDPDQPEEEACLVTFISGSTLTVTRGYDSTAALTHSAGAVVKHAGLAVDFREANLHVNAVDAVHGVLGDIVGDSDVQTLTNKAISGSNNTITDISQSSVTGLDDSLALKANLAGPTTFTGTIALPSTTSIGPVSSTELGYVDGVTSNIQTQFNDLSGQVATKAPINSPTFTGTVTLPSSTSIGTVSAGEIAALDGVVGGIAGSISNLQAQINSITGGGVAVPTGGATGDILVKKTGADYDMEWRSFASLAYVPGGSSGNWVVADGAILGGQSTGTYSADGYTYKWHKFTLAGSPQSLDVSSPVIGTLLLVGGGGASGSSSSSGNGGAGGGGGVYEQLYAFGTGSHTLWVGIGGLAGGSGGLGGNGNGGHTYFEGYPSLSPATITPTTLIAYGGGKGGNGGNLSGTSGYEGGSGGGGGKAVGGGTWRGGSLDGGATDNTTVFRGSIGGSAINGGYGGGAGMTGANAGWTSTLTGSSVTYAAGGLSNGTAQAAGANNTGNGASGTIPSSQPGANGGSGIIVVRYRIA